MDLDKPNNQNEVDRELSAIDGNESDGNLVKPKIKRNYTPEQRKQMSERMKAVNAKRIEDAKKVKDELKEAKEKIVEKLTKQKRKALELPDETETKAYKPKVVSHRPVRSQKQIVVEVSSDDDDDIDDDETSTDEEEILIMKKKPKQNKVTKSKPSKPTPIIEKQFICKFI